MGGTGLEPVTPSLSSWQRAIRRLALVGRYYAICRSFASSIRATFASVCTLSRGLVVARGSTVDALATLVEWQPRFAPDALARSRIRFRLPLALAKNASVVVGF